MKTLLLSAALILAASSARADMLQVAKFQEIAFHDVYSAQFEINKDLGRAWVQVSTDDREDNPAVIMRYLVPGLKYDMASQEVRYNNTVCAEVKPGLLGLGVSIQETGNCALKITQTHEPVDNGFEVDQETFEVVTMDVK